MVDSSVSGSVRRCLPLAPAIQRLVALVLDVSKAHSRLKIRPSDQGLLCFHRRGRLCQCLTLNFGARASGYYWARFAGLLSRLAHTLLFLPHCLWICVDDFLSVLPASVAPAQAALLSVLLLVLRVPMSWRKASLGASVTWIGWRLDLHSFSATMELSKNYVLSWVPFAQPPLHSLRMLTGKLLCVCSLLRPFRPSLAPLYLDRLSSPFSPLGLCFSPFFLKFRFFFLGNGAPPDSDRKLSKESQVVRSMWSDCLSQSLPLFDLRLAPLLECQAFADACADSRHAGLGGFVSFPSGCTAWFRARFSASELSSLFPWFPSGDLSPQSCIAAWELLAQMALPWCVATPVPGSHQPVHHGRAYQLRVACVPSCLLSFSGSVTFVFLSTLTTRLVFVTLLRMVSGELLTQLTLTFVRNMSFRFHGNSFLPALNLVTSPQGLLLYPCFLHWRKSYWLLAGCPVLC